MENLPIYISALFMLTTGITVFLFYRATYNSRPFLLITAVLLIIHTVLSVKGFYTNTKTIPPRFLLLIGPPLFLIALLFFTKKGRRYIDSLSPALLTLVHVIRIPVELTLYWLFIHKAVPQLMTFEGRNFDIFSGLTAPFVYYFGFVKKVLGRNIVLLWNCICLGLLLNVVTIAVLSAPLPFQQMAFDQPNMAVLHFPFVWLPGCVVPLVLFSHLAVIRQLWLKDKSVFTNRKMSPAVAGESLAADNR